MRNIFKRTFLIQSAQKSYTGTRKYNEDCLDIYISEQRNVFVLADGLGGCGHGKLAAETAVKSVMQFSEKSEKTGKKFLEGALDAAQEGVTEKQAGETAGMATTLAVLTIEKDTAQWGHVGDSRIYWFRKDHMQKHTADHSVPQMLVNLGEISEEEIRYHRDRNRLLRTIGQPKDGQEWEISKPVRLRNGDAFLLCSDGFWENTDEKEMEQILSNSTSVEEWIDRMVQTIRKNAGEKEMDNYSAIGIWLS